MNHQRPRLQKARSKDDPIRHSWAWGRWKYRMLLILLLIFAGWFMKKIGLLERLRPQPGPSVESPIVSVRGRLVDPLTLEGVHGIDMVSGSTTVRTLDSGQYAFGEVVRAEGIRVTAPGLLRALVFLPPKGKDDQSMTVYFAADLWASLTQVLDAEMRGRWSDVYGYVAPEARARIDQSTWLNQAQSIVDMRNIGDQEIAVADTRLVDNFVGDLSQALFPKVIAITVAANGKTAVYAFTHTDEGWQLVR